MAAVDAATGAAVTSDKPQRESGFEPDLIAAYLLRNAAAIESTGTDPNTVARLRELASTAPEANLEDLDRTLTVLEDKMAANLLASAPEEELTALRAQADRELAPYRGRMQAIQIKQVQAQFLHKRLLEARNLPRLSLFYITHE